MAVIPPVTRLTSSIIRLLGCNPSPMTLQGTNTYLLGTGKRRMLIDTGDVNVPEYICHLDKVLKEEQASIATIILTHWHHDHVGGVKDVLKLHTTVDAMNCEVLKYPRTDAPNICPEIPDSIKVKELQNGQELKVDGATVCIMHTPGHTTDHVVLLTSDGNLFSGDCILGEGTAVFEDLRDYMESLQTILSKNPKVIYPGHGNVIEDPIERIQYYIDHRNQREAQLMAFFTKRPNQKFQLYDVVKEVYRQTPSNLWSAAAINVGHHLEKLQKDGKVTSHVENNEKYYVCKDSETPS